MNVISSKTAQQIVDTVKEFCGYDINFINEKGMILASTDTLRIGTFHEGGMAALKMVNRWKSFRMMLSTAHKRA